MEFTPYYWNLEFLQDLKFNASQMTAYSFADADRLARRKEQQHETHSLSQEAT